MLQCRVPVVAAVNGPAVGLGCSLVALSDVVYMARERPSRRPPRRGRSRGRRRWADHVAAAHQLAARQGVRVHRRRSPAERAAAIGLINHVCEHDEVFDAALACARRIATLPQLRGGGDEAHDEHPPGAFRAGDDRLRDGAASTSRSTPTTSAPTSTARSSRPVGRRRPAAGRTASVGGGGVRRRGVFSTFISRARLPPMILPRPVVGPWCSTLLV